LEYHHTVPVPWFFNLLIKAGSLNNVGLEKWQQLFFGKYLFLLLPLELFIVFTMGTYKKKSMGGFLIFSLKRGH
jgi:hypothetical protein